MRATTQTLASYPAPQTSEAAALHRLTGANRNLGVAFAFQVAAYEALLQHGINYRHLPEYDSLLDAAFYGLIDVNRYYTLLSEALAAALERKGKPMIVPNVPDVGTE